jgi:hypothetical protein
VNRELIIKAIDECSKLPIGGVVVLPFEARIERAIAYKQIQKEIDIFNKINQRVNPENVGIVKPKLKYLNNKLCISIERIEPLSHIYVVEDGKVKKESI